MFKKAILALGVSVFVCEPVLSATTAVYNQMSPVYSSIKADAEKCADGKTPGTVGYSIHQAQQIHTKMASVRPNTESLFDINSDCFAGLTKLLDLSFAIPSLASILSAVQKAVLEYAKKKICTAVLQATTMITSPINAAIGDINKMEGFTDLNGMTVGIVGSGMRTIDPKLGAEYLGSQGGGDYTMNTNQFGVEQTTFSTSSPSNNNNTNQNNSGSNTNIGGSTSTITNLQVSLASANLRLNDAIKDLQNCLSGADSERACEGYQQTVDQIRKEIEDIQRQMVNSYAPNGSAPSLIIPRL